MANNVYQQQQQQHNGNPHHCKECGLYLNSAESLEVHLQYHKENLLNKWASQASSSTHGEETNNNSTKPPPASISSSSAAQQGNVIVKREFVSTTTVAAAADSSDSMIKRSPDYINSTGNRTTPDTSASFGHPPTPQSYHSASSPYQTPDNSAFSPNFPAYGSKSGDRGSPASAHHLHFQQQASTGAPYGQYGEQHYFQLENPGAYNPDYPVHKMGIVGTVPSFHRYHPYGNHSQQHHAYERGNVPSQVSSSSPASGTSYPPQPTPSPSPKQCDKCGFVCESASQLTDHLSVAHPPNITSGLQQHQMASGFSQSGQNQQQYFSSDLHVKSEEETQSEILDLDSHKVHQVYQEDEKQQRPNGELNNGHNPHSVTAMLNPWPHHQQKIFPPTDRVFHNGAVSEFINGGNNVPTTTTPEMPYRPFEQSNSTSGITSTQMSGVGTNAVSPALATAPPPTAKAANWKSNEARRPKTYNCTACNKWFTSSGHLKRHYNTTLHKNAVKTSNQPDPATMPISVHHHPARDSAANREDLSSNSPIDDSRSEDCFERTAMLQQQQQAIAYDRPAAPNILHSLHSPMQQHVPPSQQQTTLPGSPPNGEAGPPASTNLGDSRGGLLSTNANNSSTSIDNITSSNNSSSSSPLHIMHQHHGGYQLPQIGTEPPPAPPPPLGLHPPPSLHPHHHMQGANTSPMVGTTAHPHAHHQFQMYPNECAPHVTQATVISSLSTTGKHQPPIKSTTQAVSARLSTPVRVCIPPIDIKREVVDDEVDYCVPDQQQHEPNTTDGMIYVEPLPSFAHIQSNRYQGNILLTYGAANVGGSPGLNTPTAPLIQYYTMNNGPVPHQPVPVSLAQVDHEWHHVEPEPTESIHYEADYKLTILGPTDGLSFITEDSNPAGPISLITSATAANVCGGAMVVGGNASYHVMEDDSDDKFKPSEAVKQIRAASPEKAKTKREPLAGTRKQQTSKSRKGGYEESSPTISSTTVLKDVMLNTQRGGIHKCYECDKLFNKSCYLTQHNKTFHCGDKPFKCSRCGKRFSWEAQYTDHLSKHAGEKPHKCDLCPKQFNHKTDLRRHMCLHTGQKPYACDTCGKGFIRKDHMMKHCEIHMRKTTRPTSKVHCEVTPVH